MMKTMITAHSGCEGTLMDSMESVDRAIELGVEAIEMDIRRSEDGLLYVSHDRRYGDAVLENITVESVFQRIQDTDLKFNCDIKEPMAIPAVLGLGRKYGLGPDRLILTGAVSPDMLSTEPDIVKVAAVYQNLEEMLKFLYLQSFGPERFGESFAALMGKPDPFADQIRLDEPTVTAIIGMMKVTGVRGINLSYKRLDAALVDRFHSEGLEVSVFTVNDEENLDRILSYGVENITTKTVASAVTRRALSLKN